MVFQPLVNLIASGDMKRCKQKGFSTLGNRRNEDRRSGTTNPSTILETPEVEGEVAVDDVAFDDDRNSGIARRDVEIDTTRIPTNRIGVRNDFRRNAVSILGPNFDDSLNTIDLQSSTDAVEVNGVALHGLGIPTTEIVSSVSVNCLPITKGVRTIFVDYDFVDVSREADTDTTNVAVIDSSQQIAETDALGRDAADVNRQPLTQIVRADVELETTEGGVEVVYVTPLVDQLNGRRVDTLRKVGTNDSPISIDVELDRQGGLLRIGRYPHRTEANVFTLVIVSLKGKIEILHQNTFIERKFKSSTIEVDGNQFPILELRDFGDEEFTVFRNRSSADEVVAEGGRTTDR